MGNLEPLLVTVAARLQTARHICVLTGAGISAESGVPDFSRRADGHLGALQAGRPGHA